MARRVGFGGDKDKPKGSSRAPRSDPAKLRPLPGDPVEKEPIGLGARIFTIIFLWVWLIGWSGGIVFAAFQLFAGSDFSKVFLVIWLVMALFGWFFAVKALIKLLTVGPTKRIKSTTTAQPKDDEPKVPLGKLTRKEALFKAAQIAIAGGIAIQIENDFMFFMLIIWAGNELRKAVKRGVDWEDFNK